MNKAEIMAALLLGHAGKALQPSVSRPTRPLGKTHNSTWRKSRHFLSRRSRANRRKAARKAK